MSNIIAPEYYALLSFSINLGAYLSETIRSAIESVDRGQFEAANAIGMSQTQTMLKIILPQALTVALPTSATRSSARSRIPRSYL